MEEDKSISKVEKKGPVEEHGESETYGEISDKDGAGYSLHFRELKLKFNQAIQDCDAKRKTYAEAGKMYMEVIESQNIGDLDAKQKMCMEAGNECKDALIKILEAQRELVWQQQLVELSNYNKIISDCNETIQLIP
ncbi:hypothetical protein MKX03_019268, partial [Papaver bracteatum]